VPTWAGFIFQPIVPGAWSRRQVGWSIGEGTSERLVLAALDMAPDAFIPGLCGADDVIAPSAMSHRWASSADRRKTPVLAAQSPWKT
jgi:transposase InsO family protein